MTQLEAGPRALVLQVSGINCDRETAHAFGLAGARVDLAHISELKSGERNLRDYQIFSIPGGFSYGDDLGSGKVLALELETYLGDQINDFVQRDNGLILGICNGFQVLTRTGLLPFGTMGEMGATLAQNSSGRFESRPVNLRIEEGNRSVFLGDMDGVISLHVANGEGNFQAPPAAIEQIESEGMVVFRYTDALGNPTQEYPLNPSNSMNAIAGITDPSGRILGLMPHPERSMDLIRDPNWRRHIGEAPEVPPGLQIFQRMVQYAAEM